MGHMIDKNPEEMPNVHGIGNWFDLYMFAVKNGYTGQDLTIRSDMSPETTKFTEVHITPEHLAKKALECVVSNLPTRAEADIIIRIYDDHCRNTRGRGMYRPDLMNKVVYGIPTRD